MISPSTRFWGLPCGVPRFWRLLVSKGFAKPKYYIGQSVIYLMPYSQAKIPVPVTITGIAWSGIDWEYLVELPDHLPFGRKHCIGVEWVDSNDLNLP